MLSAYDAQSHVSWRRGLVEATREEVAWTTLALPARHFAWRARSNPLSWWLTQRQTLEQTWDVVLATSMTELATLRGLAPSLAKAHTALYFHENQQAYPTRADERAQANLLHLQLGQLYSALCADALAFNSAYNRDTFFEGSAQMLGSMPEGKPLRALLGPLRERARVLPVPLAMSEVPERPRAMTGPLRVAWNHRWEHDKAPQRFFEAVLGLIARGHDLEVIVLGQRFRRAPECFEQARQALGSRLVHMGYVEDASQYRALLASAHVVVSTALHEFQGLAMQEAMALGCRPAAPARQAYPEYIGAQDLYASYPEDSPREVAALVEHLEGLIQARERGQWTLDVGALAGQTWPTLKRAYLDLLTPSPHDAGA